MDAKSLMVGDWVRYEESKYPFQVLTVSYMGVVLPSTGGHNQHESDFEPILLTEDILKANGWIKDRSGVYLSTYCYSWADSKEVRVTIEEGEGFIFAYISTWYELTLHYVHELQHALRLCGLTELADNFKLE